MPYHLRKPAHFTLTARDSPVLSQHTMVLSATRPHKRLNLAQLNLGRTAGITNGRRDSAVSSFAAATF